MRKFRKVSCFIEYALMKILGFKGAVIVIWYDKDGRHISYGADTKLIPHKHGLNLVQTVGRWFNESEEAGVIGGGN